MLVIQSKNDYNANSENDNKVSTDHYHDKYITTQQINKLTTEYFSATLAQANLASKYDSANFVKQTAFDSKLKNLNKNELNELPKMVKQCQQKD